MLAKKFGFEKGIFCSSGTMKKLSQGQYKLTSIGMEKGGKLFIDSFQEKQLFGN